jgi:hypothetical protein
MKTSQPINRIWRTVLPIAVYVLCAIIASDAFASQVTLAWDPSTEIDVVGYRIHYGTVSGSYSVHIDVRNVTVCTLTGLLAEKTYYFAATVYDNAGNESGYSNEVGYTVPALKTLPWLQLLLREED